MTTVFHVSLSTFKSSSFQSVLVYLSDHFLEMEFMGQKIPLYRKAIAILWYRKLYTSLMLW
jgi:hypothetical protein